MPTRRAALIAGATFLAGAGLGSACGYALGSNPAEADENQRAEWLKPTGDARLDELRRLAIAAPDDELWSKRQIFVDLVFKSYGHDAAVWAGIDRIATRLTTEPAGQQRRVFSRWLYQAIEKAPPENTRDLQRHLPILRQLR